MSTGMNRGSGKKNIRPRIVLESKESKDFSKNMEVVQEDLSYGKFAGEHTTPIHEQALDNLLVTPKKGNIKIDPIVEANKIKQEGLDAIVHTALVEVYYNALPLDEDYKISESKRIKSKALTYFHELREANMFFYETSDNTLVESIVSESKIFNEKFSKLMEDGKTEEAEAIYDTFLENVKSDAVEAIDIIETKVMNASLLEQEAHVKRKELLESIPVNEDGEVVESKRLYKRKLLAHKTLFESLARTLIAKVINETAEDVDGDLIYGETIEYYTMLETLHTLKFFNTSMNKLNENLRTLNLNYEDFNILK